MRKGSVANEQQNRIHDLYASEEDEPHSLVTKRTWLFYDPDSAGIILNID